MEMTIEEINQRALDESSRVDDFLRRREEQRKQQQAVAEELKKRFV